MPASGHGPALAQANTGPGKRESGMADNPQVHGIYSKTEMAEAGQGGSLRKFTQKTYWFVRRHGNDRYEVFPLNSEHLPAKVRSMIAGLDFLRNYVPEVDYYQEHDCPLISSLKAKMDASPESLDKAGLDKDELRFCKNVLIPPKAKNAVLAVKAGLEALFGGGLANREVKVRDFNASAISLRKAKHHDEALRYYHAAMDLNDQDENIHFNMARVYFEIKEYECCIKNLISALKINPRLTVAKQFIDYIDGEIMDIDERSRELLKEARAF
jgi:tetratricopeptide (TPR) repeat protein